MGWVWRDGGDDGQLNASPRDISESGSSNPRSVEGCSTRRLVKSQCRTEEVEPGKFVRKCEKTEEVLRECIGKPVEVVQSNKEYTEEDVTDEVLKGGSFRIGSSDHGVFDFPGLRSDIEVMERNIFAGLSRFVEAAEEMKNGFFDVFAQSPRIFDAESSSLPSTRQGIPIEEHQQQRQQEASRKPSVQKSGDADLSALARDV